MTDAQIWRIAQLEREVADLKRQVAEFQAIRNQMLGMNTAAKYGVRVVTALGGVGLLDFIGRWLGWFNSPWGKTH